MNKYPKGTLMEYSATGLQACKPNRPKSKGILVRYNSKGNIILHWEGNTAPNSYDIHYSFLQSVPTEIGNA